MRALVVASSRRSISLPSTWAMEGLQELQTDCLKVERTNVRMIASSLWSAISLELNSHQPNHCPTRACAVACLDDSSLSLAIFTCQETVTVSELEERLQRFREAGYELYSVKFMLRERHISKFVLERTTNLVISNHRHTDDAHRTIDDP